MNKALTKTPRNCSFTIGGFVKLFVILAATTAVTVPVEAQQLPLLRYSFTGTVNDLRSGEVRPVPLAGYFDVEQVDNNTNKELKDSGLYGSYSLTNYHFSIGDWLIDGGKSIAGVSQLNNAYFDSYSTDTPYARFGFVVAFYEDYFVDVPGLERVEIQGQISFDSSRKNSGDLPLDFTLPSPSDSFSVDIFPTSWNRKRVVEGYSYLDAQIGASVYDRFSVSAAPVPEPSTWIMTILGFGAVGYAMRRKTVLRFV